MTAHHVRAAFLKSCLEVVEELGVNTSLLLDNAGLSKDMLLEPESFVPLDTAVQVMEAAALEAKCEHIGLLIGSRVGLKSLGILGVMVHSASSFHEGLKDTIKYLSLNVTGLKRTLTINEGIAVLSSNYDSSKIGLSRQARQLTVSLMWAVLTNLTIEPWRPISISFTFSEPKDRVFYRKLFKTHIYFNAEYDGIAFHEADLKMKLATGDKQLHQIISNQVIKPEYTSAPNFIDEVKNYIAKNLELGITAQSEVLKYFPMELRTFQNRFKKHGTSYQEVLDEIRFKKAELYLADSSLKLYQIADLLGYKSGGAFSLAFNNRYKMTPSQWKKSFLSQN
ncbi:AraC family transcriptional regulator [Colwellia psychrerythraea]|uniref:Transcriptional regulator, AraC family n=1 Tax=Colwellia psychrerythraea TaxID=28229 RepID=A0A099K8H1_COLPS|nr:AraC family transcriptional regulator [Colwellia psychrerythraea]KGJ86575.1 transcriptional regulator, AraC family [Colwellia psychrerythraea]